MDWQHIKKRQTFLQTQNRFGVKSTKITSVRSLKIMQEEQNIHYIESYRLRE